MPKRKSKAAAGPETEAAPAAVRPLWSGTITFGLVSIPVELLTAVRPRPTSMKLVDKDGHALGRQYHCSKENKKLSMDELVRGYKTESGEMIVITDEEFESVAPEMSADIELRNFVPLEQIPPLYFQRPYYLAPAGKSAKAYNLLAATMERTGRVGIGSFVMRGHEYLVAIVTDNGVLRADTLRYADEIRSPESIGLPKKSKPAAAKVNQFVKEIDELTRKSLDIAELDDPEAKLLQELVEAKQKEREGLIHPKGLESAETSDADNGRAKVIDLMAVLKRSLSKKVVVTNAQGAVPISLAERREQRASTKRPAKRKSASKPKATRKAPRKRARRD